MPNIQDWPYIVILYSRYIDAVGDPSCHPLFPSLLSYYIRYNDLNGQALSLILPLIQEHWSGYFKFRPNITLIWRFHIYILFPIPLNIEPRVSDYLESDSYIAPRASTITNPPLHCLEGFRLLLILLYIAPRASGYSKFFMTLIRKCQPIAYVPLHCSESFRISQILHYIAPIYHIVSEYRKSYIPLLRAF